MFVFLLIDTIIAATQINCLDKDPLSYRTAGMILLKYESQYDQSCLVYGLMPKSASSTVRHALYASGGNVTVLSPPTYNLTKNTESCYWFTFVRNPHNRLLSGFLEVNRNKRLDKKSNRSN